MLMYYETDPCDAAAPAVTEPCSTTDLAVADTKEIVGAAHSDGHQDVISAYSNSLESAGLSQQPASLSAENNCETSTANDSESSLAQPASSAASVAAADTSAQVSVAQVTKASKDTHFLSTFRPIFPCDDETIWRLLQLIMAKPIPDIETLNLAIMQWSGYSVYLNGVRAMLHYYPETVATFFHSTLPFIFKCALQLKALVAEAEVRSPML